MECELRQSEVEDEMEEFTSRPDLEELKAVKSIKEEAPGVDKATLPQERPLGNGTASKGRGRKHCERRSLRGAGLSEKEKEGRKSVRGKGQRTRREEHPPGRDRICRLITGRHCQGI